MLLMGYSYLCPNRQRNAVDKLRVRSGSSGLVASGRLTARIIAMAIDIYERIIIEEAGMGTGSLSEPGSMGSLSTKAQSRSLSSLSLTSC